MDIPATTEENRTNLPPDNPGRTLSLASADDPRAMHLGIAGDTYTILISGEKTQGPA